MIENTRTSAYYEDKLDSLRAVFGTEDVQLLPDGVGVDGRVLPVVSDVIVALEPHRLPPSLRRVLASPAVPSTRDGDFAREVQQSFGEEWLTHPEILPEHEDEFRLYFDLVDVDRLDDLRLCDLGCGIGRWSHFLTERCQELVLVDYSEAIFVARKNLSDVGNAIFVMADILDLPFSDDAFDLVFCLGVLHHLPVDALEALRTIRRLAPRHLVYLYYALDNRPAYFRWIFCWVTAVRKLLARVRSARARSLITSLLTLGVYAPCAVIGRMLRPFGWDRFIPLAEAYAGKSLRRIHQDVYDRFFTSIEQRFRRDEILAVRDTFASVTISNGPPYWHFLCER